MDSSGDRGLLKRSGGMKLTASMSVAGEAQSYSLLRGMISTSLQLILLAGKLNSRNADSGWMFRIKRSGIFALVIGSPPTVGTRRDVRVRNSIDPIVVQAVLSATKDKEWQQKGSVLLR